MHIISIIYQLPQLIVGWITTKVLACYKYSGVYVATRFTKGWTDVSLGDYIIFNRPKTITSTRVKHEKGHSKQSIILGPLYLPIIGIPSLIGNILHRYIKFSYYKQPWEAWADKLGGVQR